MPYITLVASILLINANGGRRNEEKIRKTVSLFNLRFTIMETHKRQK